MRPRAVVPSVALLGLLVTLTGVLLSVHAPARAAGAGVIDGQVKNGTTGVSVPTGLEVVLHVVAAEDRVDRVRSTTDAEGRFRFEGLDTAAGLRYLPAIEYGGALYFPRPITLDTQPQQSVEITIYEPTTSDRWIAYERANVLVQGLGPNRLDLMEMGSLANVGDRTYVGADAPPGVSRPTLRFSVPPGALDLAPQVGFAPNDISMLPDGFTIGSPVVPGRHQLAFGYSLTFDGDRLELTKRLDSPTRTFNLYLPDLGIDVQSPQLKPQGPAELGGQRYLVYTAQGLPGGTQLKIRLAGLPAGDAGTQPLVWSLLGLGCVVLGIGVFAVYRRRLAAATRPAARPGTPAGEPLDQERLRLLVALAQLDERYELGELYHTDYEAQREQGKRRLVALGPVRAGVDGGGR